MLRSADFRMSRMYTKMSVSYTITLRIVKQKCVLGLHRIWARKCCAERKLIKYKLFRHSIFFYLILIIQYPIPLFENL